MKKSFLCFIAFLAMGTSAMKAEGVEFAYEAGAELVSVYQWRGQYLGGLSFQPNATVGFESEHLNFQGGIWASVGASDWGFRKETEIAGVGMGDGTYFVPEIDFTFMFTSHGVTLGLTHYYYCDGGNFFGWKTAKNWTPGEILDEWSSSTTELTVGYNFEEIMPQGHNLYVNWNTMIAGNDFTIKTIESMGLAEKKHNYSSYLELGYDYTFEDLGLTLGAQMGIVPWASNYYGNDKGTVTNLSLRVGKTWEFDACELELFGQGALNPYLVHNDPESAFVKASGDNKIECQSLMGTIGLGVWF